MDNIRDVSVWNGSGQLRSLGELTKLFQLCLLVLDGRRPSQAHALAPVLDRIDRTMGDSDCAIAALVVGLGPDGALALLSPLSHKIAVYADPDASAAAALGLNGAPALVWISAEPAVRALVEGWDPPAWRRLLTELARTVAWFRPLMPAPGDPAPVPAQPFVASPALAPANLALAA